MSTEINDSSRKTALRETKVRQLCLEDLPAVLDISNWATRHTAANFKTEPDTLDDWVDQWKRGTKRHPWFAAERSQAVIGFAMASPFNNRCGYANTAEVTVYVHPDHQGKGIGQALYHELIPTLKAQGYRTLMGVIAIPNPASDRLHAKFGFRKIGTLARVGWKLGQWHDVAYWQLMLSDSHDQPAPIRTVAEVRAECSEAP